MSLVATSNGTDTYQLSIGDFVVFGEASSAQITVTVVASDGAQGSDKGALASPLTWFFNCSVG
jgi:hypothetical protein